MAEDDASPPGAGERDEGPRGTGHRDDALPAIDPDRVAAYARRVREQPGDSVSPAFPPVEPRRRPDPYNAFVTTFLADGPATGPLDDLQVAIKDNVAVAGVTMTCGTDVFAWEPDRDATIVARLRAAAASLEGTTNMDPFAFGTTGEWSAHGRTENPAVPGCVPGGSSSGSAAAVAGDLVDAAIGTDTAGSVRIPASFSGIVGVKPTFGLVPRDGVVDLSPSNDHVGVLSQTVADAARVLETVAGRDTTRLPTLPGRDAAGHGAGFSDGLDDAPEELQVGVPEEFVDAADPAVAGELEVALDRLLDVPGVHVTDVEFPEHEAAVRANDVHTLVEFADLYLRDGQPIGDGRPRGYREAMREVREAGFPVADRVRDMVALGAALLENEPDVYGLAWDTRFRVMRRQEALFGEVDVLATPTTPMTAPGFGAVGSDDGPTVVDTYRNTAPFNVTGAPAVSLPCGRVEGRPVGLQLVAPPGADAFLLRAAQLAEEALE